MDLSKDAIQILEARYLTKDETGEIIETPEERFLAVAKEIASAEKPEDRSEWAERFHSMMEKLDFLPNTPTLVNAGKPRLEKELRNFSACTVLPFPDDIRGIGDMVRDTMLLHKTGSGTGYTIAHVRPEGDIVKSTGNRASGPISFSEILNTATGAIKQGGVRRGAMMLVSPIWHPDIEKVIVSKRYSEDYLTNFNISIGVTDEFLRAVEEGKGFDLRFNGKVYKTVDARYLFNLLVECAWSKGEPGIIYLDNVNRGNPVAHLGELEATNPCGELPLLPYEACNLGSINLLHMLKPSKDGWTWDASKLRKTVTEAVRFLDNVVELTQFPVPQFYEQIRKTRKIGLGVMGWADALIRRGIPYGSVASIREADRVMGVIDGMAYTFSSILGEERGNFGEWAMSDYGRMGIPMRNAVRTAIAPTGTISRIAGVSSGIEPLFGVAYTSNILDTKITTYHPLIKQLLDERGITGVETKADLPEDLKRLAVTFKDVSVDGHLSMQASFQKHVNSAVSKTINLPFEATTDDIARAYMGAWKRGIKGLTVYRDGSRDLQVIETKETKKDNEEESAGECST